MEERNEEAAAGRTGGCLRHLVTSPWVCFLFWEKGKGPSFRPFCIGRGAPFFFWYYPARSNDAVIAFRSLMVPAHTCMAWILSTGPPPLASIIRWLDTVAQEKKTWYELKHCANKTLTSFWHGCSCPNSSSSLASKHGSLFLHSRLS